MAASQVDILIPNSFFLIKLVIA